MGQGKGPRWELWELEILELHYRSLKAPEIQRRFLPHRALSAIRTKASQIHAGKWSYSRWSEHELDVIRTHYPTEGSDCADRLRNRTRAAIKEKAWKIGVAIRRQFD